MAEVTGKTSLDEEALARWRQALSSGHVRLEFGFAFGASGTYPTITVWTKNERGRWEKVSPYLVEMDGGGRAALLEAVAALLRDGESDG